MISVIITAGGSSTRFKGQNKLLYKIDGKPVISFSVELFNSLDYVDEIIISANESIVSYLQDLYYNFLNQQKQKLVLFFHLL